MPSARKANQGNLAECSRRHFGVTSGLTLGGLAISAFETDQRSFAMGSTPVADQGPSGPAIQSLHFPARAKRVIFLFMHGGPSHVDTFDYKPRLAKDDGKPFPLELPPNIDAVPTLLNGPWGFKQRGQSGLWVSDLLPHMAKHADSLCVIRSMHTKGQSHGQAVGMVNTGSDNLVRPIFPLISQSVPPPHTVVHEITVLRSCRRCIKRQRLGVMETQAAQKSHILTGPEVKRRSQSVLIWCVE
jgi:hypothetical protein